MERDGHITNKNIECVKIRREETKEIKDRITDTGQIVLIEVSASWRATSNRHTPSLSPHPYLRGSFFMFVESGCISTSIEFTVP